MKGIINKPLVSDTDLTLALSPRKLQGARLPVVPPAETAVLTATISVASVAHDAAAAGAGAAPVKDVGAENVAPADGKATPPAPVPVSALPSPVRASIRRLRTARPQQTPKVRRVRPSGCPRLARLSLARALA